MTPRLDRYQMKLGARPRRHLSVIKSCDLVPYQQPNETHAWPLLRTYWPWAVVVAMLALGVVLLVVAVRQ